MLDAMAVLELLSLLVSIAVLAKAANLVVENAVRLSNFFGISKLAIGFLLIAVLTSLPELSVSVISSVHGEGAVAAGTVFGSNIANTLLILGLGTFLYGIKIERDYMKEIALVILLTTVISAYIIFNTILGAKALGFVEGIILLGIFLWYAFYSLRRKPRIGKANCDINRSQALHAFLIFTAAIILVLISSSFVVDNAIKLARIFNIAESFIGATIIAIGTSLPELSIGMAAIRKKQYGLALGDAVGSNAINLTLVLGMAAVLNPVTVILPIFIAALLFAIVANMILFYVTAVMPKLDRRGGLGFLLIYVLYIVVIFYMQSRELGVGL